MGLLGSLLSTEPLRTIVLLSTPERVAMVDHLAATVAARAGVEQEKAARAVRMAIQPGEATLLDTAEGCAVVLQDAAEVVSFIE